MAISVEDIKALRELTGAGVIDCRSALTEAGGNLQKAQAILREKGVAVAAKRAGREASQGLVEAYIHSGRIGALLELNCETDFVARTAKFRDLAHDLALQIASMNPTCIAPQDLPAGAEGPPQDLALLAQPFIKDAKKTVQDVINEVVASTGEKIVVRRFTRYELGA